jgi:hypothetical protein
LIEGVSEYVGDQHLYNADTRDYSQSILLSKMVTSICISMSVPYVVSSVYL